MWKCVRCNKENQDSEEKCVNCGHGKTMDYTGHRLISRLRTEITENWKKQKEKPMLMADCIANAEQNGTVLGSVFLRREVCEIDFVKMNLKNIPSGVWEVSENIYGTIWAWTSREADEMIALKIGSENGVYANVNCSNLFRDYSNVRKIEFNNLFDTSRTTDMRGMFSGCENLKNVDVSGFETKHVKNMEFMFYECKNLKSLDVSRFETSGVEFMAKMFWGCKALKELDVSGFKLDKVQNTDLMFYDCGVLGNPDIENFIDTLRIRDILSGRG